MDVARQRTPSHTNRSSEYSSDLIITSNGSHLEQRIFAGTKGLGKYQVQASRFMAQVIVLGIVNAMIGNDWKIGIMEESQKCNVNINTIL